MPLALKIAWKYFRSAWKGLARFTSAAAVIGIAAGVAALIIAQALSNGFATEMRDKVLSNTAHISVSETGDARISNWQIVKRNLEKIEGVERVEATSYESAVVSHEEKTSYGVLRVKDSNKQQNTPHRNSTEPVWVSIGKELASKLDLKKGDEMEILTFDKNEAPRNSTASIADVFETGLFEYDSTWIYVSEAAYQKLHALESFSPTVFGVYVNDIFDTEKTSHEIKRIMGANFEVLDWREANKPLFAALSLERKVSFAIILLIIFIAALNITTTLALLINERKIDMAVLRICGARTATLVSIFLSEGFILSASGIIFGTVLGLGGCFLGNYFELVSISKEVYSLNYIPLTPDVGQVLLTVLLAFLLCFIAMLYPVLRARKIKPLEIIRAA